MLYTKKEGMEGTWASYFQDFRYLKKVDCSFPLTHCSCTTSAQWGPQSSNNLTLRFVESQKQDSITTLKIFVFWTSALTWTSGSLKRPCNPPSPEGKTHDLSKVSHTHGLVLPSDIFSILFRWMEIVGWPAGQSNVKEERTTMAGLVGECFGACP